MIGWPGRYIEVFKESGETADGRLEIISKDLAQRIRLRALFVADTLQHERQREGTCNPVRNIVTQRGESDKYDGIDLESICSSRP